MPELPEVETLRRSLEPRLLGDTILSVDARVPRLREVLDGPRLTRHLEHRRVTALRRRAKYLLIDVEADHTLVVHLGMSGSLTLAPRDAEAQSHEHLVLELASGQKLRFRDPRRFGQVLVLPTAGLATDRHFAHLGLEPFDDPRGPLDGAFLASAAKTRRGPVKGFVLDARVVVGVGNIYAAESLFRAGIHPMRSVARISKARWDRLALAILEVLSDALTQGGTTLLDFRDGLGESGYFQVSLAVYGREGLPCPRCGHAIRRIVQSNRSTYYCPHCQR